MKRRTETLLAYSAFFIISGALVFAMLLGTRHSILAKHAAEDARNTENNRIMQASLQAYAQSLKMSALPRDRVVAARLLAPGNINIVTGETLPSAEAFALMENALAEAHQDAELTWFEATNCGAFAKVCNSEEATQRLIQLEPNNILAYLPAFNEAVAAKDDTARLELMKKMSEATDSDMHYFSGGGLFYEGLRNWQAPITYTAEEIFGEGLKNKSPITQKEARMVPAMGFAIALVLPNVQNLMSECKLPEISELQRSYCQKIAQTLSRDKTLLIKHIALRIGLRMFNKEPDASKWRELFRQNKWQHSSLNYQSSPDLDREMLFADWKNLDENNLHEKRLLANGVSLIPPTNWQPDDEEYRKIVSADSKMENTNKQ